ncbi:glycosyltransferase [Lactobacillus delbrueckii subsp. indicus]|uniref:glycosyltransferase family 2 protein n=1 Tax=Lactobacillus delbrueckii TaxID=1584 RepID=UPI0022234E4A|nr:glycosyltransferase [Lactobacillus delbrueckii]UYX12602.1 glycosyltransferase [Lactobacillus delbrueckii]UYY84417.1 glycosyltransferase [Lactobacillus delbrueckii subsp. indicus]
MNNELPLVSIIVPVYKVEKYLNQCVESIINQTYQNLEIILIDDGSPDNCGQLIDDWAKRDERIVALHQKNGGLSAARNTGLDNCHGEWLAFVDSDDYVAKDYIEKMLKAAMRDHTNLVISHYYEVDEISGEQINIKHNPAKVYNIDEFWKLYYSPEKKFVPLVVAWDKLYAREIFEERRYAVGLVHEDEEIIFDIVKNARRISIISNSLYYYRVNRSGSIMAGIHASDKMNQVILEIKKTRTLKLMHDEIWIGAIGATDDLIIDAINSKALFNDAKAREFYSEVIPMAKKNQRILSKHGYKLGEKQRVYLAIPGLICFLKRVKNNFKKIYIAR